MNNFINTLTNYADFAGRTGRNDFWMFVLFYVALSILAGAIDFVLGIGLVSLIYSLALLLPLVAVVARRPHDTGRSGWWQLVSLVPVVGLLGLIWFVAQQ